MGAFDVYLDTVRAETGAWGAWPPNQTLQIGDFGVMRDGRFYREGNIKNDFNLSFRTASHEALMSREFKSSRVRKVTLSAGGTVAPNVPASPSGKARLELEFGAKSSAYVAVAG